MRILLRDLSPNTAYQLQLKTVGFDGTAKSEWSRLFPMTTTGDSIAPKTPTGVTNVVSGTAFKFAWNAVVQSSDDSPAHDLKGYLISVSSPNDADTRVYETTDTKFDFSFENNVAVFGTPQAAVRVQVAAIDNNGNTSAYSSQVLATNPAPVAVTGLSGVVQTDAINLKWTANTTDTDLKGYEVHVSTTGAAGAYAKVYSGFGTSYVHPTTLYGTDHYFRAFSVDVFGTLSSAATSSALRPNSPFSVDTVGPAVPTGLAATLTNATDGNTAKVVVTWTAVTDTDGDLSEYIIDYKPSAETNWNTAKVDYEKTALTITNLLPYTNYDLRIRASDFSANLSGWSSTLTKTATTNTAPSVPTGLTLATGIDGIIARWTANTEPDMANGAGVYDVTVATNAGFSAGVLQYRTGADNIAVNGLTQGTTYWVRVRATDSGGISSAYSSGVSLATGTTSNFKYLTQATAPSSPSTGDIWMDTTSGFEKQWSGSAWANTGNVSTAYMQAKATDLIVNGTGMMGTDYNFSQFTFDKTDAPTGASGSFDSVLGAQSVFLSDEYIPLDATKRSKVSFSVKQKGSSVLGRFYVRMYFYPSWSTAAIPKQNVTTVGSTATLTAPLNPGDTVINVDTTSGWYAGAVVSSQYIGVWPFVDPNGRTWSTGTYTERFVGGSGAYTGASLTPTTIPLNAPYAGTALPTGTEITNQQGGDTYNVAFVANVVAPSTWTSYSGFLEPSAIPPGASRARLNFLSNYVSATNSKVSYGAISMSDASAAQDSANTALAAANGKNKVIHSTSVATGTTGYVDGDTWVRYDGSNNIIGQWRFSSGAWVSEQVSSAFIANLDAGKLTANSAFLTTLNMGTNGIIQSAGYTTGGTTGFRLSETGLVIKGTGNTVEASVLKGGTVSATTINVGAGGILNIDSTGVIKSNNYSAGSTGYQLSNTGLEVNDGSIDAKVLKTNTAIIGDLTIGRSADALGTIKSFDYSAGNAGWKIGKGLFEINSGLIKAAALQLQNSPNSLPPQWTNFEYQNSYYSDSFWTPDGQNKMFNSNAIISNPIGTTSDVVKGGYYLKLEQPFNTNAASWYFGTSATDYNTLVEVGKRYIYSIYTRNTASGTENFNINIKGNNGAQIATMSFSAPGSETTYTRRSVAFTVPAGATAVVPWMEKTGTTLNLSLRLDCAQLEERTGVDDTPSVWKPPGTTTMDGSGIVTGMIRSTGTVSVSGVVQPSWSINLAGNAQFGDTLVRGKMLVGAPGDVPINKAPSNGDFETNVTGYTAYHVGATSPAIARTTTSPITGTGSANVTAAAGSKTELGMQFSLPASYTENVAVMLSFKVRTNTTNAGSTLRVNFLNGSTVVSDAEIYAEPVAGQTYGLEAEYVPSAGESINAIRIYHAGTITSTSVMFDDVTVYVDNEIGSSYIASTNYVRSLRGWKLDSLGNLEANQGQFRGSLKVGVTGDPGVLNGNILASGTVTGDKFAGRVVLASLMTSSEDPTVQRWEASQEGIRLFSPGLNSPALINLPTDPLAIATFRGDVETDSLIVNNNMAIRGVINEVSKSSRLILSTGTTKPSAPPTAYNAWESYSTRRYAVGSGYESFDESRWSLAKPTSQTQFYYAQWVYGGNSKIQAMDATGAWISGLEWSTGVKNGHVFTIGDTICIFGIRNGTEAWVEKYNLSGVKTSEVRMAGAVLTAWVNYTATYDGTNICMFSSNHTYAGKAVIYKYHPTTGAHLGSQVLASTSMDGMTVLAGSFDFGTPVYIVGYTDSSVFKVYNASTAAAMPQHDFCVVGNNKTAAGLAWDGTRFWSHNNELMQLARHSTLTWDASKSSTAYYGMTWHASVTGHETTISARRTIGMYKRASLRFDIPRIPDDPDGTDPITGAKIYLARSTSTSSNIEPANSVFQLQGQITAPDASEQFDVNIPATPVVGNAPPTVNNFLSGAPAQIVSADSDASPNLLIKGDGGGNWGALDLNTIGAVKIGSTGNTMTNMKFTRATLTFNASGMSVVTHGFGATPAFIVAQPEGTMTYETKVSAVTSTTFTINAFSSASPGTPFVGSLAVAWLAIKS